MDLSFLGVIGSSGLTQPYVSNTAAAPASNVNVTFLDAAGNFLTSGSRITVASPYAAATYTPRLYTAYYQSGTPVSPGMVQGTAYLDVTYY